MQLLHFWRATGLDAVCWTYSGFTFYKQTPSTFTFSLSSLDVTTDNTQSTGRGVRAASSLWRWAMELRVSWQWGAGLVLGPPGLWGVPWHTQQALGAPTRALGAPKRARDAAASADPEVSLSPWQLRRGAGEALESSPALVTARGEGPARRKPNHQAGETDAESAVLSEGTGISWQC